MRLSDARVLVTGAGKRVGEAIAVHLAEAGCDVVVHYRRSEESAAATARQVRAAGRDALLVQADLGRPEQIAGMFARIGEAYGGLDILVNSASSFRKQRLDDVSPDDWDLAMDVNLRGPFLCVQHAARLMGSAATRGGAPGCVVNIADLSGEFPWRGYVQHGVSKAGLLHLTRIAARELAPDVRVNAVVPGPILPPPGMEASSDAWRAMGEMLPLGHTGNPLDIARAIAFLAESDFATGTILHIDGGQHLLGPAGH